MSVDPVLVTAITSAVVALIGTAVTFQGRQRESGDKRVETLFDANEALVGQLQTERAELRKRLETLEHDRDEDRKELARLRDTLAEQGMQMYVLRAREVDMRAWMSDIMAWAALAVGLIRGLDRHIEDPPPPPNFPAVP